MDPRNRQKTTSRYDRWHQATAIAIAGLMSAPAIVAPAWAGTLSAWGFNAQNRHLTLTVPTGTTPTFFLMAQPARIVLDVPNTRLGDVARSQQLPGVVRSIRLSENGSGTRIVLELAPNTRLDPRHADLTATDLGNGRTQWVLTPLIQGEAPTAIATVPVSPPAIAPPAPASSQARPSETPPVASPAPVPSPVAPSSNEPAPEATTLPDEDEVAPPAPATPIAEDATESAPSSTTVRVDALPTVPTGNAIALPVTPPPVATPTASPLPSVATTAAIGAAAALPDATIARRGVRTDAAPLMGVGQLDVADVPPGELPIDPFMAQNQAVSAPPLAEVPRTSTPTVSVPPLSDVPAIATVPNAAPPSTTSGEVSAIAPVPRVQSPEISVATNLEEGAADLSTPEVDIPVPTVSFPVASPPPSAEVEVATNLPRPAPQSGTESVSQPPPIAPVASIPGEQAGASVPWPIPGAVSTPVTPIEIPVIPMAPDSWRAIAMGTVPDNELPPPWPNAAVAAPSDASPAETGSGNPVPLPSPPARDGIVAAESPAATPTQPSPPFLAATSPDAEGDRLSPPQLAGLPNVAGEVELPPFLETTGQAPLPISAEIPPPPDPDKEGVIPFGAPLQTKAVDAEIAPAVTLPVGTRFALQYAHSEPLVLEQQQPVYEVLRVVGDVHHPETGEIIMPAGTPVLGRFEGFDESGRRFVTQFVPEGGDRSAPLLAESDWLVGTPQPRNATGVAAGSAVGATAVTLISGFSGVGLVGGAALGAAAALGNSPRLVIIDPGETIQVEVVSDILPFH